MKKTIKKITAALSAALMCALPMANAVSANAAGGRKNTFRNYIEINAGNKPLYYFYFDKSFDDSVKNSIELVNYDLKLSNASFSYRNPQTGRYCFTIESRELNGFKGEVLVENFECSDMSVNAANFLGRRDTYVVGSGNNYRGYYDKNDLNVNEEVILVGDANGNGTVDLSDAILINMYKAGNISQIKDMKYFKKAADVNNDGVVNTADSVLIQDFTLHNINSFGPYQG